MKYQLFRQMLTGFAIAVTLGTAATEPSAAQSKKFFCSTSRGVPATVVRTSKGNVPIIIWVYRDFDYSGWTPEHRCQEISDRFQRYDDRRLLGYIRTGTVNGYPVLCVANYQGGACDRTQVLITLKPGSDAQYYLQSLLETRTHGVRKPVYLSGEKQEVLSRDENGELYADVEEWIKVLEEENSQPVDRGNSQESDLVW
jgi:hypothetical protein